jgi:hypothetical protein
MSQPVPEPKKTLICLECGTANPTDARECWMCHGTRWKILDQTEDHTPYPQGFFSTISGWMILIAGIGLVLGLYELAPAILLALSVFVVPPLVIVEIWAARRRNASQPMTVSQRVGLFLLLAILLPVVLVVAVVIALFAICSVTGPPSFH